jgi:hypothetical protein
MHEQFLRLPKGKGQKLNGLSRAKIYEVAQAHPEIFRKVDGTTLIDMQRFNKVLASYPAAVLGPPKAKNDFGAARSRTRA